MQGLGLKQGNDIIRFAFLNSHSSCYMQNVEVVGRMEVGEMRQAVSAVCLEER